MRKKPLPSLDRMREVFELDLESGRLFWKPRDVSEFASKGSCKSWNAKHAGREAGHLTARGYRSVCLEWEQYPAHRIVYMMANNVMLSEDETIDHKDGNLDNNTPGNLRIATTSQNCMNKKVSKNNILGLKGVWKVCKRNLFVARIMIDGKSKRLGYFRTAEEAHAAYAKASKELHGEFGRVT